ncbi:MAG TPA: type II secretion system protein GspG [Planctomycetota bacterium]|nr:type II secretion system protein GspG [Planctomycetota bacterium]
MSTRRATWVRIALLAILLGWCAEATCVPPQNGDVARVAKADSEMRLLADAVRSWRRRHGHSPASLHELVTADATGMRHLLELPIDPWGHDYELRDQVMGRRATFVVSAGPNGVFGDGDDVSARAARQPPR